MIGLFEEVENVVDLSSFPADSRVIDLVKVMNIK
jgi:hypothetical protein